MLVITAERLPHDTTAVLSDNPAPCESVIALATGLAEGQRKPDPVHCVLTIAPDPAVLARAQV